MPLQAIALLGWMERDEAIEFLRSLCVFDDPLDEGQAIAMWEPYRQKVEELPNRAIAMPHRRLMRPEDRDWERKFLQFVRQNGAGDVRSVIKINLADLVIHQKIILTDRAEEYRGRLRNAQAWNELSLPITPDKFPIQAMIRRGGVKIDVDIDVPHGEWFLLPQNCNGELHLKPAPAFRHVTVTALDPDRMLLWAGYHRSYARALIAQPDGNDCPALVALAENVVVPPIAGNEMPFDRLVRGPRAPLFRDFFDERFFMRVPLRRKRYQMQIRSTVIPIDDP